MTDNSKRNCDNKKSALDRTLKILLLIWKKIKHYAGLLIIDKLMRNIVSWYDKKHLKLTPVSTQRYQDGEEIHEIRAMLDAKNAECEELSSRLNESLQKCEYLNQEIARLNESLGQSQKIAEGLLSRLNDSESKADYLQHESEDLRKRCLPETEVPSMIYYGQGDASGLWLRKISPVKTSEHLYQLNTQQGNTSVCQFAPIPQKNQEDIIANRNITLLACEIVSIAVSPSSIENVESGEAVLDNNRWKVVRKAKIKLI